LAFLIKISHAAQREKPRSKSDNDNDRFGAHLPSGRILISMTRLSQILFQEQQLFMELYPVYYTSALCDTSAERATTSKENYTFRWSADSRLTIDGSR